MHSVSTTSFSLIYLITCYAEVKWSPCEQLDIRVAVKLFETVCGVLMATLAYRNILFCVLEYVSGGSMFDQL